VEALYIEKRDEVGNLRRVVALDFSPLGDGAGVDRVWTD